MGEGAGTVTGAGSFIHPTWDILIPTLGQRRDNLAQLLDVLLPQTEAYGNAVRVVALWNNGERRIAEVRQDLLDYGDAEYRCFVDDDDMVTHDYVSEIMQQLVTRPQIIGFNVRITWDGRRPKLAYTNLKYNGFGNLRSARKAVPVLYRDITHLCPIQTKIARLGSFGDAPEGHAEDMWWIQQMRGLMHDYRYISRTLYHYRYSKAGSSHRLSDQTWKPHNISPGPHKRLEVNHPNFTYHHWTADV